MQMATGIKSGREPERESGSYMAAIVRLMVHWRLNVKPKYDVMATRCSFLFISLIFHTRRYK